MRFFSSRFLVLALLILSVLWLAGCTPPDPSSSEAASAPAIEAAPAQASAPEAPAAPAEGLSEGALVFVIDPSQSEARFVIDEELMGSPKTVIGVNDGVSGEVMVNPGDPTSVQIGPIVIEAGGFVTDSDRRNGAIQRFILQSSSYPSITFTSTAIEGLPASVAVGDSLSLQVTGDLTIRKITHSETFAVTVEVVSANELHISGATQVLRETYELTIPSIPNVANVTNEIQLEFDLVAVR